MNTQNIKIISRHDTLAEAVEASGIDLSYNEQAAKESIRWTDNGHRGHKCIQAFVCEDGKVRYIYQADIRLLHVFTPFVSCLSDSPFQVAFQLEDTINYTGIYIQKTSENRKKIRALQNSPDDLIEGRHHLLAA